MKKDDDLSGFYAQYSDDNGEYNSENFLIKINWEGTMVKKTLNGDQGAYLDEKLTTPLRKDNAFNGQEIYVSYN